VARAEKLFADVKRQQAELLAKLPSHYEFLQRLHAQRQ
jgi:uncharacterized protein YciI